MRQDFNAFLGLAIILCAGSQALAVTPELSGQPYKAISIRNVFGLKPPPPPTPVETVTNIPPSKVQLLGIAEMFGVKKAVLKPLDAAKPGQAAQDTTIVLSEGEAQQGIEIKAIDEKAGTVTINNRGATVTLNFKDDGVKLPAGAPPANPGIPAPAFAGVAQPAAASIPMPAMAAQPAMNSAFGSLAAQPNLAPGVGAGLAAGGVLPSRPMRVEESAAAEHAISYDQKMAMFVVERERVGDLIKAGKWAPMPNLPGIDPPSAPTPRSVTPQLPGRQ